MTAVEVPAPFTVSKIRPQLVSKGKAKEDFCRTETLRVGVQVVAPLLHRVGTPAQICQPDEYALPALEDAGPVPSRFCRASTFFCLSSIA